MTAWRIVKWMWLRGTESGCILGGIYGTIIFPLIGTVFGLLIGTILGTVTGVVTGVGLALLARVVEPSVHTKKAYPVARVLVAVACTATICDLLLIGSIAPIVLVIASAAAGFFAWRLPDAIAPIKVSSRPANAVLFYIEK